MGHSFSRNLQHVAEDGAAHLTMQSKQRRMVNKHTCKYKYSNNFSKYNFFQSEFKNI